MEDRVIIAYFLARSEKAVDALEAKYGRYCRAIASKLLTDPRDVEECISDCWMTVWNTIPPTVPLHFQGWLGTIVRNRAVKIGRDNGKRAEVAMDALTELSPCFVVLDEPYREIEHKLLGTAVSEFLMSQKADHRIAFMRRYWYSDSIAEVSKSMGWSAEKTKSILFRLRRRLKDYLTKEGYL